MTKRKRKMRIKKVSLFLFILFLLCLIIYFLLFNKEIINISGTQTIKGYDYTLEKRDSNLMKDNFNELRDLLKEDNVDYEKYAELISKLFVIDLYTINNKKNSYDVGGIDYVYDKENFKISVQESLYKYLENKNKRDNSKLPEVESIEVLSNEESKFTYNEKEYDSYLITLSWKYKKDLGYDDKAEVEVVKIDDKLYIASFNPKEA